ncbi:MAG: aminotransferase class I/II-fold pyridoxal phosphate-dependent enzyme, partial [Planctomycetota bacterium]
IEVELRRGVKLAVFASPDNPTGSCLDPSRVLGWCERYPDTLFLIDEAYAEYSGASLVKESVKVENLLILRTFSKAWGMAGLRLGAIVGQARLLDAMARVRCPYSVNAASVQAAGNMLSRADEVEAGALAAMERKERLVERIESMGFGTVRGAANFFLLMAGFDAPELCAFLRDSGILVRDRSSMPGLWGTVRVTVGTVEENRALVAALEDFRSTRGLIFDLDDTIVDTSRSYDVVVGRLVEKFSGAPSREGDLASLRAEGGFNDDWDAAMELLRRRGVSLDRGRIEEEGKGLYLESARESEDLLIGVDVLERLASRYRLFLLTGRPRDEYDPVWGGILDPLFESVVCRDDEDLPPKPAPDQLEKLCVDAGLSGGAYVGNSVDDMVAARGAGLRALAVATTLDEETLKEAGAELVLGSPKRILEAFKL